MLPKTSPLDKALPEEEYFCPFCAETILKAVTARVVKIRILLFNFSFDVMFLMLHKLLDWSRNYCGKNKRKEKKQKKEYLTARSAALYVAKQTCNECGEAAYLI